MHLKHTQVFNCFKLSVFGSIETNSKCVWFHTIFWSFLSNPGTRKLTFCPYAWHLGNFKWASCTSSLHRLHLVHHIASVSVNTVFKIQAIRQGFSFSSHYTTILPTLGNKFCVPCRHSSCIIHVFLCRSLSARWLLWLSPTLLLQSICSTHTNKQYNLRLTVFHKWQWEHW
jgi:hypothetical protein